MWRILLPIVFLAPVFAVAQTNTLGSGNWTDGSVWSTGAAPAVAATANVNHPLVLNTNITITTGTYNFFQNVTDIAGGSAYTLTMTTAGGTLDIKSGTTTFEGAALFDDITLFVRSGATLILGATQVNNQTDVTIEAGGTLIINGNLTNNNNGIGTFVINGLVQVNGNYSAPVGNVDIGGSGEFFVTGSISTTGSSDVFGSTNDCPTGPCSGRNLCSFSNAIAASQTLCSSGTPAGLTGNAVASPTYAWESSTTSSIAGFGSTIAATQNFSPGALTQTTWYRRKVTSGGCTGTSTPVTITVLPTSGGWKGTTNDWNLNTNWCDNTVPASTTDVSISTGVANMPQITAASSCRNLTINTGATVTINGSNTLSIFGNLTNSGSLTTNTSTVSLSGSAQQTVSGNPVNFNNLTLNNSAVTSPQLTVNSFVTVLANFTMTQGNANLSAYNLTIGQSAASPGTLSYAAGRLYNGNLTRWFNTTAITVGNTEGHFPVGSSADYRPFFVGHAGLSTGGTIRAGHTAVATTSNVSFADGASTIIRRNDSFWSLATGNGIATAGTFLVRAEGTGFGTVADVDHLHLVRAADATGIGTKTASAGTLTNPQVNRNAVPLAGLTNNFYMGSTNASSPLPISLISFSGRFVNQGVQLDWSTASQENFDYFQVERSVNGIDFSAIHQLAGEGESTTTLHYSFLDVEVKSGKYYYRLRNVDRDGTFEFSKIIYVDKHFENRISVYPNPVEVNSSLHIDIEDPSTSTMTSYLYDRIGLLIGRADLKSGENALHVSGDIAPGVYILKIQAGTGQMTIRLLIQ